MNSPNKKRDGRPTHIGDKIECRVCKELVGRYPRGSNSQKRTLFVCGNGKHWSGLACPSCHNKLRSEKHKETYSSLRGGRPTLVYIEPGTKMHTCRKCGDQTVNHYHCKICLSGMADKNDVGIAQAEFLYG